MTDTSINETARILSEALPFLQRYDDQIIVVKFGGHAMVDATLAHQFARDMVMLKVCGLNPIVVHGGGPQIKRMLDRRAVKAEFRDGLRVTDQETMDVVEMVLAGSINKQIVGYITRGKGVSVHAATCPNVLNLLYDPERRIDVEWDKAADASPYTVRLRLHVEDRKGILADVSSRVAGINTNIQTLEATTDEQRGSIRMTVEISDLKHLERVIKSLKGVEGVLDVERASR